MHMQGPDVFPIPGTKRLKYLEENAVAYFLELTTEDKRFLEDTFHEDKVFTSSMQSPSQRNSSDEKDTLSGSARAFQAFILLAFQDTADFVQRVVDNTVAC